MLVNVLHLSDLHFGAEPVAGKVTSTALSQRQNTLDGLLDALARVGAQWKPGVIAISGDLAWKGSDEDYQRVQSWLRPLLAGLNLAPLDVFTCPGNHDIDRKATLGLARSVSAADADEILKPENVGNLLRPFSAYSAFCTSFGLPSLEIGTVEQRLFGQREVKGLRFVVLNSAWFCRDDQDQGKLWLGLPQLEVMNAQAQIARPGAYDTDLITVALVHHPKDWFHQADQYGEGNRKNAYQYLADRSHVILSGHVHGKIERPTRLGSRAYLFTGGASYAGSDYRNNFSIVQLDTERRTLRRISFEFDPRDDNWHQITDPDEYDLRSRRPDDAPAEVAAHPAERDAYDYGALAARAQEHARVYVEQKSWAIARTSTLPETISRQVGVHNRMERLAVDLNERLLLRTRGHLALFGEMVSVGRPTFLFGDLGSGKSTLVGGYVVDLALKLPGLLPLLIPARFFADRSLTTLVAVSNAISDYVNEQIAPQGGRFDLQRALSDKVEVTLVLDGMDELDRATAQRLLFQVEELTRQWSGMRVIATGRPIELIGLNYNYWQCLEMAPLSPGERVQLLVNEALAEGMDPARAAADGQERLRILEERPELLAIADTPLTVRLLRPALVEGSGQKSLGDLLYDILQERLGGWDARTGRIGQITNFSALFPTSLSREPILARIAAAIHNSPSRSLTREALHAVLESVLPQVEGRQAVLKEGYELFAGVLHREHGEVFVFPSQPLLQCALGAYIAECWGSDRPIDLSEEKHALWREYSFAAAIARRRGTLDAARPRLSAYCDELMHDDRPTPIVAAVVSEAADAGLAGEFIATLRERRFRPIRWFSDAPSMSAAAFAHAIRLAGRAGFAWYYEEYLNPIYPLDYFGFDVAAEVLRHWLMLAQYMVEPHEANLLTRLIMPHQSAQSLAVHKLLPVVAFAVPHVFSPEQRIEAYAESLIYPTLRTKATELLRQEGAERRQAVLAALEKVSCRSDDRTAAAARLWLELSDGRPPAQVVRSAVSVAARSGAENLLALLEARLGAINLRSLLRWYVPQGDKLAADAALILYAGGERSLPLLGAGLMSGLNDGGRVDGAEEALHVLIQENGADGLWWLVDQFPHYAGHGAGPGAPSAFWRILLAELQRAERAEVDLLHSCLQYLGEFTLSRYPEVRRAIETLLSSKPDYRLGLEEALSSLDTTTRFNAASLLFVSLPKSAALAAEIVVRGASTDFHHYELYSFCLRLAAGQSVTSHLAHVVESLSGRARTFALAILFHNHYALQDHLFRELVLGLVGDGAGFDNDWPMGSGSPQRVLAQVQAYPLLLECLDQNGEQAAKAADVLLMDHRDKLSPAQYAKCWTLAVTAIDYWSEARLDAEAGRIRADPEFVAKVAQVAHAIQADTRQEPVASLYVRTFFEPAAWIDLLWRVMHGTKRLGSTEIDQACMWLFARAHNEAAAAQPLGAAAVALLNDPRTKARDSTGRPPDPTSVYWLSFLGHEFGGLPIAALEAVLVDFPPNLINNNIASTLLARAGHVPVGFQVPAHTVYLSYDPGIDLSMVGVPTAEALRDVLRDGAQLPPNFTAWLEWTLLTGALTEKEVAWLAFQSRYGAIFSLLLTFCRGAEIDYASYIASIGTELSYSPQDKQAIVVTRATGVIGLSLARDPNRREEFFTAVEAWIVEKDHEAFPLLCSLLLAHRRKIPSEPLGRLFTLLIQKSYFLTPVLAQQLAEYFAYGVDDAERLNILAQVKGVLAVLSVDQDPHPSPQDGMRQMLFSLACFCLQGNTDEESIRVFLLGLRSTLIQRHGSNQYAQGHAPEFFARDILIALYSLFEKVPTDIFMKCFDEGSHSDVPEVKAYCRILAAFAGQNL